MSCSTWFVSWRRRRALRSAEVLDEVVDAQVAALPRMAEARRRQAADYLAEVVLLAATYRHYANGWISRRELDRRARAASRRMEACRTAVPEQLTERE